MAKKKAKAALDEYEDNGPADGRSDLRDSIQSGLRKTLSKLDDGPTLLTNAEALARCGGIAMPSLCLRYLFHQDTLPLGRILTLSGLFRSNKTALSFEIGSWIIQHMGMGWYNSVEEKDSPDMRYAIMRHRADLLNYIEVVECSTQEQWQGSVSFQVQEINNRTKNSGMIIPAFSIVDSVAAAPPKNEYANFLKDKGGAGARGFATIALLNSNWLQQITHRVNDGPFLLMLIQHSTEKPADTPYMAPTRTQKGGMEVGFAKTMALEMTRVSDIKETDSGGGALINIECTKNSLGPTKRAIRVNAKWWWEEQESGPPKQQYVWDWHEASMTLLLGLETAKGRSATWKKLKDICDLHGESRQRVWSKALGIPQSSPVSYREASEILEYEHPELLPPIYDLLHISRRPILLPGADLGKIWDGTVGIPEALPPLPYPREPALGGAFEDE